LRSAITIAGGERFLGKAGVEYLVFLVADVRIGYFLCLSVLQRRIAKECFS